MDKRIRDNRFWLNDLEFHGDGYMRTTVVRGGRWLDATIKFADCSRTVTLDFGGTYEASEYDMREMENNLSKIDQIITELQGFRRDLKKEYNRAKPLDEETD